VLHLDQTADWGQPVDLAAKVDLTDMDTENLCFYSYDKAGNSYRLIEKSNYWIDAKGYVHFTTEFAGDIIISEGPLTEKLI
jgi:mRNA-degrading endonuclease HigB of HigAB toxin-antitoxin module